MPWFWQRDKKPKREKTIPEGAVRRRLRYTGRVQNVGFRYTAQGWARNRDLTGWVANLDDGDVALEVQGTPDQIQGFLDDVAAESSREKAFIHAVLVLNEEIPPVPENRFSLHNVS